jgi:type I restriction enzyme R subunit
MDKRSLSESDVCDLFITPAIRRAGWDPITQIRREVTLTPGLVVRGNVASRNKKKKKLADYVLSKEPGVPIGVVEAKDNSFTVSRGLQQALGYAEILDVPSAFSSNGDAFASHKVRGRFSPHSQIRFPSRCDAVVQEADQFLAAVQPIRPRGDQNAGDQDVRGA